ncbi:TetR/AcrR family transcriptional regulator [Pontibacillus litoralis]|uniref:TetR family transcriptional regulator n=1 Tax=Pontibacillus litoralis JSM 072002 TaxID=1385512 RepID=A0A0A5HZN8_9BACI|nr:TetR/AcrR family transcriptional regulator [Pontibacillus litoralis]KGX89052.1 TetR family transcriptional regulator [Pontibacillus litoralis JSM 072002]
MKKSKPKYKQIIDAAVEVIAENGYHASQVSKIAKKAGVADGTIYIYFKNKEDVLISLFEDKMGLLIEKIQEDIRLKSNVEDKLFSFIHMHFHQLAQDHHLAIVTQLELRQSNKQLRLRINNILKPYLEIIDQIVQQGIQEGVIDENIDSRLVRQMVFGTLDETVTNWVMKEQKYDLVKQAYGVHSLLINGLMNKEK